MDLPPLTSPLELDRQRHQAQAYRMLYGSWEGDLLEEIRESAGQIRADAWGRPDTSANPVLASANARATLYDEVDEERVEIDPVTQQRVTTLVPRGPQVNNPAADPATLELMRTLCDDAAIWPTLQGLQRDTLGIRDMLLRVDVSVGPTGPTVALLPVHPHLVEVEVDPGRPTEMVRVLQWGIRRIDGRDEWTAEEWSVRGGVGEHRVLARRDSELVDVSAAAGLPPGGVRDKMYPISRPVLPFVGYHARRGPCFWDPRGEIEIRKGTLVTGKYMTYFGHVMMTSAYRQRYVIDAEPIGGEERNGRRVVVADPSTVMPMRSTSEQGGPQIGSFEAPVDPSAMFNAILAYERRLAGFAGLDPADVQRASGDPRSGYALAISQAGKIRQARRYAPTFRAYDQQLLNLIAIRVNDVLEAELGMRLLPELGWTVDYPIARAPIPADAGT